MKKLKRVIFFLFILIFIGSPVFAASRKYHTYEVVEVTEKTITLQRQKVIRNVTDHTETRELISVTIDRSRYPNLEIGDKVRYNKKKDRLGRILPKK